jgi:hypothetical protein
MSVPVVEVDKEVVVGFNKAQLDKLLNHEKEDKKAT